MKLSICLSNIKFIYNSWTNFNLKSRNSNFLRRFKVLEIRHHPWYAITMRIDDYNECNIRCSSNFAAFYKQWEEISNYAPFSCNTRQQFWKNEQFDSILLLRSENPSLRASTVAYQLTLCMKFICFDLFRGLYGACSVSFDSFKIEAYLKRHLGSKVCQQQRSWIFSG